MRVVWEHRDRVTSLVRLVLRDADLAARQLSLHNHPSE
jgi:hypothetical protein